MRGLLMRRLGARRQGLVATWQNAVGAVADSEDVAVTRGLKHRVDDEAVDAIGFETAKLLEEFRRLDAGRPNHELGGKKRSVGEFNAIGGSFGDAHATADID